MLFSTLQLEPALRPQGSGDDVMPRVRGRLKLGMHCPCVLLIRLTPYPFVVAQRSASSLGAILVIGEPPCMMSPFRVVLTSIYYCLFYQMLSLLLPTGTARAFHGNLSPSTATSTSSKTEGVFFHPHGDHFVSTFMLGNKVTCGDTYSNKS